MIKLPEFGRGNGTTFTDKLSAFDPQNKGSGSTIEFDPNDLGKDIKNADGSTGRPGQVGLGHELGHAKDGIKGRALRTKSIVIDPDDNKQVEMTKDEIKLRKGIDNQIRKEQGAKQPAIPVIL